MTVNAYSPTKAVPPVTELRFNEKRLLEGWKTYQYDFFEPAKKKSKKSDMWIVSGGGLALRADLKEKIFSAPNDDLEFLPIRISSKRSNRTSVLTFPSFVERISSLDIKGITFREIGELNRGQHAPA